MTALPRFQAGGTLQETSAYVERDADRELFSALRAGELCSVLAPRQIGKSSLRVRTARRLREQGVLCATIDLTRIGGRQSEEEGWYFGLVQELASKLRLSEDPAIFWRERRQATPLHRWVLYLREVALAQTAQPVVVFVDEIDTVLALPFPADDFFGSLRDAFNARAEDPAYQRLTFCLMGVALPGELMKDAARTPFNVGRAVRIADFTASEARSLLPLLGADGRDAERLLGEVFAWTAGHPYMTQRICRELLSTVGPGVASVVDELFLRRGRAEDPNLEYAERRLAADPRAPALVRIYRRLLEGEVIAADRDDTLQGALRLTGMAAERDGALRVRNRIFATVFDLAWVREYEAQRFLAGPLARWLQSGKSVDHVLRGKALEQAQQWARAQGAVLPEESAFLLAGVEVARHEEQERDRRERAEAEARAQRRTALALGALALVLLLSLAAALSLYRRSLQAERATAAAALEERAARAEAMAARPGRAVEALDLIVGVLGRALAQGEPDGATLTAFYAALGASRPWTTLMPSAPRGANYQMGAGGALVVRASVTGGVELWQVQEPPEPLVIRVGGTAYGATFVDQGRAILTADDQGVTAFSAADGARLWSARGRAVFTRSGDARFALIDPGGALEVLRADGSVLMRLPVAPPISQVLASQDGSATAVVHDGRVDTFDADGRPLPPLRGLAPRVIAARFVGEQRLVTTTADGALQFWQAATGALVRRVDAALSSSSGLAVGPNRGPVMVLGCGAVETWWDAEGNPAGTLQGQLGCLHAATFDGRGARVLTVDRREHAGRTWDLRDGREIGRLVGHRAPLTEAEYSPDGGRIATASEDGSVRIWSALQGVESLALRGHAGAVVSVSFSPDGERVVSAGEDGTLRVWRQRPLVARYLEHGGGGEVLAALSPKSRLLATVEARTGSILLWDGGTGRLLRALDSVEAPVSSASLLADDTLVISGFDGTLHLIAPDGHRLRTLKSDPATLAADTAPGGQRLVASGHGATSLFDLGTGGLLRTLPAIGGVKIRLSADGRWILSQTAPGPSGLGGMRPVVVDAETGEIAQRFPGSARNLVGLWMTASGDTAVVCTDAMRAYSRGTGRLRFAIGPPLEPLAACDGSSDLRQAVFTLRDGRAIVRPLDLQANLSLACRTLRQATMSAAAATTCAGR